MLYIKTFIEKTFLTRYFILKLYLKFSLNFWTFQFICTSLQDNFNSPQEKSFKLFSGEYYFHYCTRKNKIKKQLGGSLVFCLKLIKPRSVSCQMILFRFSIGWEKWWRFIIVMRIISKLNQKLKISAPSVAWKV